VIDVPVGHQNSSGTKVMLSDDVRDTCRGVLAGVDDDAFFSGSGCDDIAVGPPGPGRECSDEHRGPSWIEWILGVVAAYSGDGESLKPNGRKEPGTRHSMVTILGPSPIADPLLLD
jgi:hypothetical protein